VWSPRSPTWMEGLPTMRCGLVPQGNCPHNEHINVCEFQHLAHLLSIKMIQHISVLPWCKLKVAQPCFLLSSNCHTNRKVKTSNLLAHHITSYIAANSQRICLIPVTLRRKNAETFCRSAVHTIHIRIQSVSFFPIQIYTEIAWKI
jgi:hypothetical protein